MQIEEPIRVHFLEKEQTLEAVLLPGYRTQNTADLVVLGKAGEERVYIMNPISNPNALDELSSRVALGYIDLGKCKNDAGTFSLGQKYNEIKYDGMDVGWVVGKETIHIAKPTASKFQKTLPKLYKAFVELSEKHPEKLSYSKQYHSSIEWQERQGIRRWRR